MCDEKHMENIRATALSFIKIEKQGWLNSEIQQIGMMIIHTQQNKNKDVTELIS